MSWNPSVRAAPIVASANCRVELDEAREREMAGAAAAGAAIAFKELEGRSLRFANANADGQASAWVIRGRIEMTQRWPV